MEVYRMEVMPLGTNCYIAFDADTKEGVVIDPGGSPDLISNAIDKLGVHVTAIIDTHGHWDHIGANSEIKVKTGAPICIHTLDQNFLTDPGLNISSMMGTRSVSDSADLRNPVDKKKENPLLSGFSTSPAPPPFSAQRLLILLPCRLSALTRLFLSPGFPILIIKFNFCGNNFLFCSYALYFL